MVKLNNSAFRTPSKLFKSSPLSEASTSSSLTTTPNSSELLDDLLHFNHMKNNNDNTMDIDVSREAVQALTQALSELQIELRERTNEESVLRQTVQALSTALQTTEQARLDACLQVERLQFRLQAVTFCDYDPYEEERKELKRKKKSHTHSSTSPTNNSSSSKDKRDKSKKRPDRVRKSSHESNRSVTKSRKDDKTLSNEKKSLRESKPRKKMDMHPQPLSSRGPIDLDDMEDLSGCSDEEFEASYEDDYHSYENSGTTSTTTSSVEGDNYDSDDSLTKTERVSTLPWRSFKPPPHIKADGRMPVDLDIIDDLMAADHPEEAADHSEEANNDTYSEDKRPPSESVESPTCVSQLPNSSTRSPGTGFMEKRSLWSKDDESLGETPSQASFYRILQERDYAQTAAKYLSEELLRSKDEVEKLREQLHKSSAFLELTYADTSDDESNGAKTEGTTRKTKSDVHEVDQHHHNPQKLPGSASASSSVTSSSAGGRKPPPLKSLQWLLKGHHMDGKDPLAVLREVRGDLTKGIHDRKSKTKRPVGETDDVLQAWEPDYIREFVNDADTAAGLVKDGASKASL
jgi:hypothetical protein